MKESQLYSDFIKRNFWLLVGPVILAVFVSIYFYAQMPTLTKISQAFTLDYEIANLDEVLALTDQAVAELRAQRFTQIFPGSSATIYKSAPLTINIEAASLTRETSYTLLLKESEYLRQHFSVTELTSPEIVLVEPDLFKYLISGLIVGGFFGLVASLIKEYLKNY